MARVFLVAGGAVCMAFGLGALLGMRLGAHAAGEGMAIVARPSGAKPIVTETPVDPSSGGFLGVVFARQQVDLAASVEARLATVPVQLGQRLSKGDTVATLDAESVRNELAQATAALRGAQAEAQAARVEQSQAHDKVVRAEKLGDAISSEELESAHYQERLAGARLAAAHARVSEAIAKVDQLRQLLENTAIVAPFDGVVAARYLDPGTIVGPGKPIIRLISGDDIWVRFAVPEGDLGKVGAKACVEITVPSLAVNAHGVVEMVAPQIDAASRMLVVEARIALPDEWRGRLPTGLAAHVRAIPCGPSTP